ncbi:MAG TPA: hypothetical protein VG411_08575, partial [Actinomycetota bacterium]|nr:hypothetical protein [Actinomycetota bacterium]
MWPEAVVWAGQPVEHTIEVIDHLREIPDPAERLRRLFELAFGGDVGGAISVALYANAGNHLAAGPGTGEPAPGRVPHRGLHRPRLLQGHGQASRPGRL